MIRPHREWLPLVGQVVEVRLEGNSIRRGRIDAVTPDDAMLWIAPDGAEARRLYLRNDGFEVWIDHRWESTNVAVVVPFGFEPGATTVQDRDPHRAQLIMRID